MKLTYTNRFEKDYKKLPSQIQKRTDQKFRYLVKDISHPSLRVKRIQKYQAFFEGSITKDYRFVFEITPEGYILHRVGKHDVLNKL